MSMLIRPTALLGCASAVSLLFGACSVTMQEGASPVSSTPLLDPTAGTPATVSALPTAAPTSAPTGPATTPDGAACGGMNRDQKPCADGSYCNYAPAAMCGAADATGLCAKKPAGCSKEAVPVCGCDGRTYPNACMAAAVGTSVAKAGSCALEKVEPIAEGGLCGTRGVSGVCRDGLFCDMESDCGASDRGGKCTKVPTVCNRLHKPVCGCDAKVYSNACAAAAARMSVNGRLDPNKQCK